jgi:ATP-dependent helicase/nuclease subunit B
LKPWEKIYYPDAAFDFSSLSEVKDALCDTGLGEKIKISEGKITNDNMRLQGKVLEAIYKNDLALTQTRIDTFVDCPFAYYLCYNLKLSENERAEFDARNIGTFVHAMLENFLGEIAAEDKDIRLITEEEKNGIIKRSAQKYLDSITEKDTPTSKRTDIMIDRIFRASLPVIDGICDELCGCKFKPRFFELKIGTEDENLPTPAVFTDKDGKRVSVYGSIDRVDTYESGNDVFVRVIDYKTGRKVFSPDDIDEGKNLQMFLYLKALAETENEAFLKRAGVKEGGRIIPAGVIYVQTDLSDVTIPHADKESEAQTIRKKQGRRGMVLNDAESLNAMNPDYLPVKFKKDGDIDSRYKKFAYTPYEWDELNERISNKMLEISGRMRSGEISPTKEKGALCEWCKYKSVCRKKLN